MGREMRVMFIGRFTNQPWQNQKTDLTSTRNTTLDISNRLYDSMIGAGQYNRYLDEKIYAEGEPGLSAEGLG